MQSWNTIMLSTVFYIHTSTFFLGQDIGDILGTPGMRWEYLVDGTPVHSHTFRHSFRIRSYLVNPPTSLHVFGRW